MYGTLAKNVSVIPQLPGPQNHLKIPQNHSHKAQNYKHFLGAHFLIFSPKLKILDRTLTGVGFVLLQLRACSYSRTTHTTAYNLERVLLFKDYVHYSLQLRVCALIQGLRTLQLTT